MATKSFFKNIVIKDRKSATTFLNALENAEGKKKKNIQLKARVNDIKDEDAIRKLFSGDK